jgi:hypothetical protein
VNPSECVGAHATPPDGFRISDLALQRVQVTLQLLSGRLNHPGHLGHQSKIGLDPI